MNSGEVRMRPMHAESFMGCGGLKHQRDMNMSRYISKGVLLLSLVICGGLYLLSLWVIGPHAGVPEHQGASGRRYTIRNDITAGIVANIRGVNTRVVMCFVDRPLLDLVGHPEISAITDLKGKLVGLSSRGGLHDVTMRRIFVQSGMDPSQATFITLGEQGAMMTAIKSGKIAAGLLNPPHNFLAYRDGLKNLGFAGNFFRVPSTGLVTMRETIERYPDQISRVTRALTRARIFAKENKPATITVMRRFLRLNDEDLISRTYDYHRKAETPDGRVDASLMAEVIRDTRQTENIAKEIPVNQVFDFSYLPQR